MKINKDHSPTTAVELRHRAEMHLKKQAPAAGLIPVVDEQQRLLQELQLHEVELEMQNAELRQARDEVEMVLEKFTELYDFAPISYMTLDSFGAICAVNLTGASLLGIERARLLGRSFRYFIKSESRPVFTEFLNNVFANHEKESCELTLTTTGNFTLFVQIEGVLSSSGLECRAAILDISVRRALEEKLELLHTESKTHATSLAAANIELEAFNFTVSHDLCRPLTTINGYCQLLQDQYHGQFDEKSRGYLQEMYEGTLRMNRLIETLLRFSSITRVTMQYKQVDLSKIAKEVVLRLKESVSDCRVIFRVADGIVVSGDPELLRVVLDNLIGNAWKYVGSQQGAVIEFGVTEVEKQTTYYVRDNGPGFTIALADKLFIPFQRLSAGTNVSGHGIGLATVDRIIRRHGGRIWAESKVGQGATFFFTLA